MKYLVFQWIDTDYTILDNPLPGMPGNKTGQVKIFSFLYL